MLSRSANATIKGYFYQFDHTIIQLLSGDLADAEIVVEGIEDIDLKEGKEETLIQCKYYEGTEYNHSVIKEAVIQMVRHYHNEGCKKSSPYKYKIYGHYNSGQEKLPASVDVRFLKKHFLTYKGDKITNEIHNQLDLTDAQLGVFLSKLEIDIKGPSYEEQQLEVERLLIAKIPECKREDVRIFFYPLAIQAIQTLAIRKKKSERTITSRKFLEQVDKKDITFNIWLQHKLGDDYYQKMIRRKYFSHKGTKLPKKSRVFIIDLDNEFFPAKITALLSDIARKYSHVEHARTPSEDRFCPYVYLRGLTREQLIQVKQYLVQCGIKFFDGHLYDGAPFSPHSLMPQPTKENLIQLKFIASDTQTGQVIGLMTGTQIEVYEFFKEAPIGAAFAALHHKIRLGSAFTIREVI